MAIAEATEISLRAAADKAEEALRQRQELEQRHQAEIEKQESVGKEANNCKPTDGLVTTSDSFIYNQEEVVTNTREEWLQAENLADIASLLTDCDNAEMLNDIRIYMPPFALKAACKLLPKLKLVEIKQWVLQLNSLMVQETQPNQQEAFAIDQRKTSAIAEP